MKTECDEVANNMRDAWIKYCDDNFALHPNKMHYVDRFIQAEKFVFARMKGESQQVVDNVAESLCKGETK